MIRSDKAPHALIEITGVAGSGKSTVTSILTDGSYSKAPFISARDLGQASMFLRSVPRLAPLLIGNLRQKPRMTWADFKLMVYVTALNGYLESVAPTEPLVFDQGPLYALVRLRAKGIGVANTPEFSRWWSEMLGKWLDQISLVVWLDADDEVLMERLNQRDQRHDLKGAPVDEGKMFLSEYRTLFDDVASEIDRRERPALERIDTGGTPANDVARAIIDALASRTESAP